MSQATTAPRRKIASMPPDPEARKRARKAEEVRRYRQRTGYEYDKNYKKANDRAMRRLAKKYPNAFRRLVNEERAILGMPPLQK